MRLVFVTLLALNAAAACGGSGGGDDGGGDDSPGPDGPAASVIGRILVEELDLGTGIGIIGSASARFEAPSSEPDVLNDGTCRIYEYPCLGSVGACGLPPGLSAGDIQITGLTAAVTLTPNENGFYSGPGGLPDDLFADGATITATAAGDEVDAFTLTTTGVEPLASSYVDASLGLVPGQPLDLTWTAGTSGARVQLRINWADICHAGAEWYILECDVPDSGSYSVPATVTGALPTGFGHCGAQLARIRRAETTDGRNIDLVVAHGDSWAWF